jgi:hypothetical protein
VLDVGVAAEGVSASLSAAVSASFFTAGEVKEGGEEEELLLIGRPGQSRKTSIPSVNELGSEMWVSKVHLQKAPPPTFVTDSGSVIDVSATQHWKAHSPISTNELGRVMDVSEVQSEKTPGSILVSDSGNLIDVSEEQR